jgi:hypothetical protein
MHRVLNRYIYKTQYRNRDFYKSMYKYIYFINVNRAKQMANRAKRAAAHKGTTNKQQGGAGGQGQPTT